MVQLNVISITLIAVRMGHWGPGIMQKAGESIFIMNGQSGDARSLINTIFSIKDRSLFGLKLD